MPTVILLIDAREEKLTEVEGRIKNGTCYVQIIRHGTSVMLPIIIEINSKFNQNSVTIGQK